MRFRNSFEERDHGTVPGFSCRTVSNKKCFGISFLHSAKTAPPAAACGMNGPAIRPARYNNHAPLPITAGSLFSIRMYVCMCLQCVFVCGRVAVCVCRPQAAERRDECAGPSIALVLCSGRTCGRNAGRTHPGNVAHSGNAAHAGAVPGSVRYYEVYNLSLFCFAK